jgi:hypothetical protein
MDREGSTSLPSDESPDDSSVWLEAGKRHLLDAYVPEDGAYDAFGPEVGDA